MIKKKLLSGIAIVENKNVPKDEVWFVNGKKEITKIINLANEDCPKCKNIRYMDKEEVEKAIASESSYNPERTGRLMKAILKLAIPDNKKIKELQGEIERLKYAVEKLLKATEILREGMLNNLD